MLGWCANSKWQFSCLQRWYQDRRCNVRYIKMTVKLCWWLCTISQFIFRYCRHCVILTSIHKNLKITKELKIKTWIVYVILRFLCLSCSGSNVKIATQKTSEQLLTEEAEDVAMVEQICDNSLNDFTFWRSISELIWSTFKANYENLKQCCMLEYRGCTLYH